MYRRVTKLIYLTLNLQKKNCIFIAQDEDAINIAMGQYLTENNFKFHSVKYIGTDSEANINHLKKTCEVLNKPFNDVLHLPEMEIDEKILAKITRSHSVDMGIQKDAEDYIKKHGPTEHNINDMMECWIACLKDTSEKERFAFICAESESDARDKLHFFIENNNYFTMIKFIKIAENVKETDLKLCSNLLQTEEDFINFIYLLFV